MTQSTTQTTSALVNQVLAAMPASDCHLSQCRVCEPRGGCLATHMLCNEQSVEQAQKINHKYQAGEHIFMEGEDSSGLYVVKSGSVKSYINSEEGEEQVLGFFLPGDLFGLDRMPTGRVSSAVALETTALCRLPVDRFAKTGLNEIFLTLISDQLNRDRKLVVLLARKDADGRIASFVKDLADRYASRGYSATAFNLSMSRQDIGCYLGLAVETVSRTLTRFQESGLLNVRRRSIEVLDSDGLLRISNH